LCAPRRRGHRLAHRCEQLLRRLGDRALARRGQRPRHDGANERLEGLRVAIDAVDAALDLAQGGQTFPEVAQRLEQVERLLARRVASEAEGGHALAPLLPPAGERPLARLEIFAQRGERRVDLRARLPSLSLPGRLLAELAEPRFRAIE